LDIGEWAPNTPHLSSKVLLLPTTACMNSVWLTAFSTARRIAGLSNGGNS
jgi:hypothetical protein